MKKSEGSLQNSRPNLDNLSRVTQDLDMEEPGEEIPTPPPAETAPPVISVPDDASQVTATQLEAARYYI